MHLYSTRSHVKIHFVQAVHGFSPCLDFCFCYDVKMSPSVALWLAHCSCPLNRVAGCQVAVTACGLGFIGGVATWVTSDKRTKVAGPHMTTITHNEI